MGSASEAPNRLARWLQGANNALRRRMMSQHCKHEIEDLSSRLAELEAQLATAQEEIAAQRKHREALLSISEATGGDVPLNQIFEHVLDQVLQATGYDGGAIRILDKERRSFSVVAQRGWNVQMLQDLQHVPVDQAFQAEVAATHQPVYTSNLPSDHRVLSPGEVTSGFKSLICVPLLASSQLVGTMELARVEPYDWPEDEIRWLASVGRQVGTAIHLVQLSHQNRDLAILQERERLSQELHDGLAQTIGAIRLYAEEAALCLNEDDAGRARESLHSIEQIAQEAYSSIRDDILGLRMNAMTGQGIKAALAEYLSRFQRQWGIQVRCLGCADEDWSASPEAEIQLIRIIQEALTNVRRHAQATVVVIKVETLADMLCVRITDDGRGFDPGSVRDERIGLRIMRERAASVGGRLHIDSCPGEGTEIRVELPRFRSSLPYREDREEE